MTEYQKYFKGKLDKFGIKSPTELSDEDKKKFFEEVDADWTSEEEKGEKKACGIMSDCAEECDCFIKGDDTVLEEIEAEEDEQVSLATQLINLASMLTSDEDEEVVVAADTFKCPECGTKVLEQTGYCLKCKKKVKKAKALLARVNWKRYNIDSDRHLDKHIKRIKGKFEDMRDELSSYIFDEGPATPIFEAVKEVKADAKFLVMTFEEIVNSMVEIEKAVHEEERERAKEMIRLSSKKKTKE